VISVTPSFAGEEGDVLIVAAKGNDHVHATGQPVEAAIEVHRQAHELDASGRADARRKALA
jgi:hypothetical protein